MTIAAAGALGALFLLVCSASCANGSSQLARGSVDYSAWLGLSEAEVEKFPERPKEKTPFSVHYGTGYISRTYAVKGLGDVGLTFEGESKESAIVRKITAYDLPEMKHEKYAALLGIDLSDGWTIDKSSKMIGTTYVKPKSVKGKKTRIVFYVQVDKKGTRIQLEY